MISVFHGEYMFLSNLYVCNIKYKNRLHKSAEHLYQYLKCAESIDREKIFNIESPKSAKILGKFLKPTRFWDVKKIQTMLKIVRMKFQQRKKLRRLLRKTGDVKLVEMNYQHETFWGVCGCTKHKRTGLNMIGQILMMIRDEINIVTKLQEI